MTVSAPSLPPVIEHWFASRGWQVRAHQAEMIEAAYAGEDALLIAPTGGGKTLGGFLPSLAELSALEGGRKRPHRLHTLYISPLKALSVDVARNLTGPVEEMGLDIRIETRTGDTPVARRQRQRARPPDILLTTPEQIALLCASPNAGAFFGDLRRIIIDEIHALAPQKRGDLLSLGLAAIRQWAPEAQRVGLSATIADEAGLARWLVPQHGATGANQARIVRGAAGARPEVEILSPNTRIPWAGHSGQHALEEIYARIQQARLSLIFVNTRSQAEMTFQSLWSINEAALPIALHHGSLAIEQRRKVEAAMAAGRLKAVVCTSTLDLGIDWGDVDLVIQLGAPKGSSRLIQRLGRSNHRLDSPSKALLAPTNRFEHLECEAARAAVAEHALDGEALGPGAWDVLAQHMMGRACGAPLETEALFTEVRQAAPYADLSREAFDRIFDFTVSGGYALESYDRFRRLVKNREGLWEPRTPEIAQKHRLNVGTIVEAPMLKVVLGKGSYGGRVLGEVEEWFVEMMVPGDSFMFAGQILTFEAIDALQVRVSRSSSDTPKIPTYNGGKFPLSTYLAERVRDMVQDPSAWTHLPSQVQDWLGLQKAVSALPQANGLLVETFPRHAKYYLVCYPFEGRLAHQTLGMLLTRRLERLGLRPMGFVANEYAVSVWALRDLAGVDMANLFAEDMLGDDLDAWLAESDLMKRTFRHCAVIAGLIERRLPGMEKSGRQVTFSTDLIYNVLREHEPDHVVLQAAWRDAGRGLLDIHRLGDALARFQAGIRHLDLDRISPLAVPVMLEIGKEAIHGEGHESILEENAEDLIAEATGKR